jgi:hypothetical protein
VLVGLYHMIERASSLIGHLCRVNSTITMQSGLARPIATAASPNASGERISADTS